MKVLKLKKNKLSEELMQYLRANLIQSFQKNCGNSTNNYLKGLLVSAPVDVDFELHCLHTGVGLVSGMLKTKFKTTLEEDRELLLQDLEWRLYLAVCHRCTQKEILASLEKLMSILIAILNRLKNGVSLKDAYL